MPLMRLLGISLLSFLLTACGGGGSLEKDGSISDGDSTTEPATYSVSLKGYSQTDATESNAVAADSPLNLRAILTDNDGDFVGSRRITFSLTDTVGALSQTSALTNADGEAEVELMAGTVEGAGEVTATYTVDGTTYTDSFSFSSTGDAASDVENAYTISVQGYSQVDGSESNAVTADFPLNIRARLSDADENIISGGRITFALADNIGSLAQSSALTQADGLATIELTAGTTEGAGEVTATYSINGESYSSTFSFSSAGDSEQNIESDFTIELKGLSQSDGTEATAVTAANPLNIQATLFDDEGSVVVAERITFALSDNIGVLDKTSDLTNEMGQASVILTAGTIEGAGIITATYTVSGESYAESFSFSSAGDAAINPNNEYVIQLQGFSQGDGSETNSVSGDTPIDLIATLTNNGSQVSGEVITFSLSGNVGSLNASSALTQTNGQAKVELTSGTIEGAGQVTASFTQNSITYSATFSFQSDGKEGSQPAYSLTLQGYSNGTEVQSNTVTSLVPLELRATLLNDGTPVSSQSVNFSLASNIGILNPSSGSVLTNSNGIATIELLAGNIEGASELSVTYINNGVTYSSEAFDFESIIVEKAEITVSLLASDGSTTRNVDFLSPAVAQAQLLLNGEPGAYKLVAFNLSGLGTINPSNGTALTNELGIAKVDLLAGTEAGAGSITAEYIDSDNTSFTAEAFTYTTAGDSPDQGDADNFTIDLSLISSTTLIQTSEISANDNGLVQALVLDSNGDPVVGEVVSFSSTLGSLLPSSGTALTNTNGIATLNLTPGTIEGAGNVTTQYEAITETVGFYTRGDAIDPNQSTADINFKILQNCPVDFKTIRDASLCEEITSISGDSSAILFIEVTNENSTTPLTQTLVTATTTIGTISPTTGTAITDSSGIAILDIVPGRDVGAGEVTVSVLDSNLTKAFQIAAVDIDITLTSSLAANELLSAGATALISIEITKDGQLYTTPLNVEFTSGCVASGLAVMDESVTSIGGFARSTYRPLTCVGGDIITATVITGGDTISGTTTIDVSPADIGFIQFIEVTEPVISLKGTGGANRSEISNVKFKLIDSNGNALASKTVNFGLSTSVGGITITPTSAITNSAGEIQTTVQSGAVATPVRVIASSQEDINGEVVVVTAPSDILVISTGIADQNSFSLSRSEFNPHGLNVDGTEVSVNARLADHFNNPVPDGTAISFITEGGVIEPSCTTSNGACSVTWTSSNPRPFTDPLYENSILEKCDSGLPCPLGILNNDYSVDLPLGGRATVLAYAIGEETFSDLNGNGYFDSEDFFEDLFDIPEAFVDHNEDGIYGGKDCADGTALPCTKDASIGDEFEDFIDFDGSGTWTTGNGLYNGLLCLESDETAGICSRKMVNVFQNQEIVMSGDSAFYRLVTFADDCAAIAGATATEVRVNSDLTSPLVRRVQNDPTSALMCQVSAIDLTQTASGTSSLSLIVYIADVYNNPMPVGSDVTITTDNGELTGTTNYTFPNTTSIVPIGVSFGIKREPLTGGNESSSGSLTIATEATSGLVTSISIPVEDDL
ncbi:beta strand repeat-containing protein [Pseudoalteromonas sp. NGC95]|uniref:beta strand repeat-containing protein n=1 Tax=Pseudoalteromonas sp. NGC95 TaxID=2792051 RepID=UPI001E3D985B|nr:Ig domain-containing protein [Pseudoalteromonas sp. NGC95]